MTLEGNKLTQVQTGDKNTTIIREWSDTALKTVRLSFPLDKD
jgi:hypothetical protein